MNLATPFDTIAADYDRAFTASAIGRRMRAAVWRRHRVLYPLWYELRPLVARLKRRRRPSRFDLWTARVP